MKWVRLVVELLQLHLLVQFASAEEASRPGNHRRLRLATDALELERRSVKHDDPSMSDRTLTRERKKNNLEGHLRDETSWSNRDKSKKERKKGRRHHDTTSDAIAEATDEVLASRTHAHGKKKKQRQKNQLDDASQGNRGENKKVRKKDRRHRDMRGAASVEGIDKDEATAEALEYKSEAASMGVLRPEAPMITSSTTSTEEEPPHTIEFTTISSTLDGDINALHNAVTWSETGSTEAMAPEALMFTSSVTPTKESTTTREQPHPVKLTTPSSLDNGMGAMSSLNDEASWNKTSSTGATTSEATVVTSSIISMEEAATTEDPPQIEQLDISPDIPRAPNSTDSGISNIRQSSNHQHVNSIYTFGAPSVVRGTSMSNPNNTCIPGLRIYNEDNEIKTCSWYNYMWCTPGRIITNVDIASQINVKEGYHHPKMSVLVLRLVDDSKVEYTYHPCQNGVNYVENYQWWPEADLPAGIFDYNHGLVNQYEPRLNRVSYSNKGAALESISVARCLESQSTFADTQLCLREYVSRMGWQTFAYMNHKDNGMFSNDFDQVYVLKNDRFINTEGRKCMIVFQGSNKIDDLSNFLMDNKKPTSYCGRDGVHRGTKNELWGITHNPEYASEIVPALETCDDVTCVGHSLGGSLCNLFTMCANQALENLNERDDAENWDDYNSLIWTKKPH